MIGEQKFIRLHLHLLRMVNCQGRKKRDRQTHPIEYKG